MSTHNLCFQAEIRKILTLGLLIPDIPAITNIVDPDKLASEKANWSGSALFAIQYRNMYQQPGSSNLIGWKLEVGMARINTLCL